MTLSWEVCLIVENALFVLLIHGKDDFMHKTLLFERTNDFFMSWWTLFSHRAINRQQIAVGEHKKRTFEGQGTGVVEMRHLSSSYCFMSAMQMLYVCKCTYMHDYESRPKMSISFLGIPLHTGLKSAKAEPYRKEN